MDDDLFALLGDDSDDDSDSDLFEDFDAVDDDFFSDDLFADEVNEAPIRAPSQPYELAFIAEEDDEPIQSQSKPVSDVPDWLSDAPVSDEKPVVATSSVPAARPSPAKKSKSKRKRSGGKFLGMTAAQRMVLIIFFFLDVLVLGFLLLVALGQIAL